MERFESGKANAGDIALLEKFDLAELHLFEEARELSVDLLKNWLAKYKFKDWQVTETRQKKVTDAMRKARAAEIAKSLANHEKWHTHGRGISMDTLRNELRLKVTDFGAQKDAAAQLRNYAALLGDYMERLNLPNYVHARNFA